VNDEVTKVNQFFDEGIDMKLGSEENRGFTKLLLGTAIENDNHEILEVNSEIMIWIFILIPFTCL